MPKIGEKELKEQLKTEDFSPVYLIYGEESYLKEHYVDKLKNALVGGAFADFNFHQYEGRNTPVSDILHDADIIPMMGGSTFILVHDYPLDKSQKDIDALKEYFADVPQTTVIVFWYDSIEVDTKKNSKWKTVENLFAKTGSAVRLDKRTETELARLIVTSAKKRGCTINSDLARYLISVVGSDIQTIFSELEKICAYVGEGEVTKKVIDELAIKSLQARVYDLSKFILRGDSDSAYRVLNTLFAQKEEPIAILSVISSCYVDMYRVKCAKAAGENENELTQYFSYRGREFLIRNAARDCRTVSVNSLRSALDTLAETDEKMKSTSIDKNILLEETIAKLMMARNA
ncbi:MAG: DNA polymerase III subunit delta [Eubacterium sp.]|nr:DNA polymerase III subunit delta [Eubacterium sp.]